MGAIKFLRGKLPDWLTGDGDGYGYGYGDGDGDGYGYGNGNGNGNGYGYGNGYGNGDGDGDGDGYGDGYGNGDGDGDGYGYGDGDGDGDGYGYGYGDGYGNGNGNGDGNGNGNGYGAYWLACLKYFATKWHDTQRARLAELQKIGAKICYWRSDASGLPSNGGGRIEPAAPGVIHKSPGPLQTCQRGTLHATAIPPKWQGERVWVVALHGEVIGDEEKYGCLEREIIGEAL